MSDGITRLLPAMPTPIHALPPPDADDLREDRETKRRAPADARPAAVEGYVFARVVLTDEDCPEVDSLS